MPLCRWLQQVLKNTTTLFHQMFHLWCICDQYLGEVVLTSDLIHTFSIFFFSLLESSLLNMELLLFLWMMEWHNWLSSDGKACFWVYKVAVVICWKLVINICLSVPEVNLLLVHYVVLWQHSAFGWQYLDVKYWSMCCRLVARFNDTKFLCALCIQVHILTRNAHSLAMSQSEAVSLLALATVLRWSEQ